MFLIMMASYVLMKKEPFPVEVVKMTYMVFPGNVGDDTALFGAVKTLSGG
jgi:hypothetical protein